MQFFFPLMLFIVTKQKTHKKQTISSEGVGNSVIYRFIFDYFVLLGLFDKKFYVHSFAKMHISNPLGFFCFVCVYDDCSSIIIC